jgi:methyltransferase (TIGR00027 family)
VSTTRPSRTATKIARFMLLIDAVPRLAPVLPEDAARTADALLRASGAVPARHLDLMRRPHTIRFYELAERLLGRGQLLWFAVRKRWVSEAVDQALRDGCRQLLVVGAGFDPFAVMVATRHPGVRCIEVDAPATAEPKCRGIERAGLAQANHQVVSADLSVTPLDQALASTGWERAEPSIVVAEGVLMYLDPAAVRAFFVGVRACTGTRSRLAFSAVGVDERGRARVGFGGGVLNRFIQATLALAGEAMRWGIDPSAVPGFLADVRFRPLEQPSLESLRRRFLRPAGLGDEPLSPYEHLVLAERSPG